MGDVVNARWLSWRKRLVFQSPQPGLEVAKGAGPRYPTSQILPGAVPDGIGLAAEAE